MKKILVFIPFLFISVALWGINVGGADVPHFYNLDGHSLILNGTALTKRWEMNAYVHALYLTQRNRDAKAILMMNQPMVLRVFIRSNFISVRTFQEAILEGLDRTALTQNATLRRDIDTFLSAFSDGVRKGDVYDIVWNPAGVLKVHKNEVARPIIEIAGSEIKKATFGCWLVDGTDKKLQNLRLGLLGD